MLENSEAMFVPNPHEFRLLSIIYFVIYKRMRLPSDGFRITKAIALIGYFKQANVILHCIQICKDQIGKQVTYWNIVYQIP